MPTKTATFADGTSLKPAYAVVELDVPFHLDRFVPDKVLYLDYVTHLALSLRLTVSVLPIAFLPTPTKEMREGTVSEI